MLLEYLWLTVLSSCELKQILDSICYFCQAFFFARATRNVINKRKCTIFILTFDTIIISFPTFLFLPPMPSMKLFLFKFIVSFSWIVYASVCVCAAGRCNITSRVPGKESQLLSPTSQSWEFFEAPFPKRWSGCTCLLPRLRDGSFHPRWEFMKLLPSKQSQSPLPPRNLGGLPGVLPANLQQWGLGRDVFRGTQHPSV